MNLERFLHDRQPSWDELAAWWRSQAAARAPGRRRHGPHGGAVQEGDGRPAWPGVASPSTRWCPPWRTWWAGPQPGVRHRGPGANRSSSSSPPGTGGGSGNDRCRCSWPQPSSSAPGRCASGGPRPDGGVGRRAWTTATTICHRGHHQRHGLDQGGEVGAVDLDGDVEDLAYPEWSELGGIHAAYRRWAPGHGADRPNRRRRDADRKVGSRRSAR